MYLNAESPWRELFPPDANQAITIREMAEVLNPPRRKRSCPRVIKSQKRKYAVLSKRGRPRGFFGKRRTSTENLVVSTKTYP
jgi:hypothetical protein